MLPAASLVGQRSLVRSQEAQALRERTPSSLRTQAEIHLMGSRGRYHRKDLGGWEVVGRGVAWVAGRGCG
jgi:hypothetical protein